MRMYPLELGEVAMVRSPPRPQTSLKPMLPKSPSTALTARLSRRRKSRRLLRLLVRQPRTWCVVIYSLNIVADS